jgi:hypothetical protein
MDKIKQRRHRHVAAPDGNTHYGFHRPYWKHAHRDWRLWVAVFLMMVAMLMYVMSDDLAWRPRGHPRPPLMSATGAH